MIIVRLLNECIVHLLFIYSHLVCYIDLQQCDIADF